MQIGDRTWKIGATIDIYNNSAKLKRLIEDANLLYEQNKLLFKKIDTKDIKVINLILKVQEWAKDKNMHYGDDIECGCPNCVLLDALLELENL